MAHARISMYLPPDINPTQAAIAYGCRALPKLNEELQSEEVVTRQKALMALCDLMHDPEHVYEAIGIGCLESLKALLKDRDSLVRIKTTEVLRIVATHNVGRDGFLNHGIILALSFLLDDPQLLCRKNLHLAFMHLAHLPSEAGFLAAASWQNGTGTSVDKRWQAAVAPSAAEWPGVSPTQLPGVPRHWRCLQAVGAGRDARCAWLAICHCFDRHFCTPRGSVLVS
ncbi:radial spoke head 14 homolog [Choloepus didactylus]|uniref:radial spoke head 14 homolog n=1 Tax=Choloepus didactylus TaxID=27675 RepID=UPI00189D8BFA|nr:radial spoke head 14 homolog [Choloepus didactylus]